MVPPFTNVHTHVFNSACAPDRYLRILPSRFVRFCARFLKMEIDSKNGRWLIRFLKWALGFYSRKKRSEFDKYISFLEVATRPTQLEIFQQTLESGRNFDPTVRIVGLTMNMDHMDSAPSYYMKGIATQLQEIKDIKRYYPDHFFPFLGVDPRYKGGPKLKSWAEHFFETGIKAHNGIVYPYFAGIKLYPALGFFPFDPRLEELYAYAEANDIPVMTHCTRIGSQYIGDVIESLIPDHPAMIQAGTPVAQAAEKEIVERIARFKKEGWVMNSSSGNNDNACDLFGHPQNFIPVLEKFPKLKICLAHMGGTDEIYKTAPLSSRRIREVDGTSWFDMIRQMLKAHPSLYTDISYTLTDLKKKEIRTRIIDLMNDKDVNGDVLSDRVLFGTDFFMTERERSENNLYDLAHNYLQAWWVPLTRTNPQKYLQQPL